MKNNLIMLILFFILGFSISCSTDVKINADYEVTPIVYCILNPSLLPNDNNDLSDAERMRWQYVKVNKAFLTDKSIDEAAQISDSLFFNNVNVYLVEYKNGNKTRSWTFEKTDEIPKEEGVFANDRNTLFRKKIDFGNYDNNTEYDLIVDIENGEYCVTGKTRIKLISDLEFHRPISNALVDLSKSDVNYQYSPGLNSSMHNVDLKFNYWDVNGTDTIYKSITWKVNEEVINIFNESSLNRSFNVKNFFAYLETHMEPVAEGYKRLVKMPNSLEFQLSSVDDDYYVYTQVTKPSTGIVQYRQTYTNMSGGYGLFAARSNYYIAYKVARISIESLQNGEHTKHLGFASQWDNYYHPYYPIY